jgi:hypothetical protein
MQDNTGCSGVAIMARWDPDWHDTTWDTKHPGIPAGKIRVDVRLAPVEAKEGRFASDNTGHDGIVVHTPQAQRCPHCKMLLAVGNSYRDHVQWCNG